MSSWSPYVSNEGSVLAFKADNKIYCGCDSRLAQGYDILSRNYSKFFKLTDTCYLLL